MKKATTLLGILAFSATLAISAPAIAQTTDGNTTENTTTTRTDDDDHGNWGLAGLLGLLGLLGRRKRDDDTHRTTTANVNR
jgi:MYXO-CTERM domain-containing protein